MINRNNKLTEGLIEVYRNGGKVEHAGIGLVIEKIDGEVYVKRHNRTLLIIAHDKIHTLNYTLTEGEAINLALSELGLKAECDMHPDVDIEKLVRENL